jgi:hypothetical protein
MNKTVYMVIELALIALYLGLIIFVIPKGSTVGIIMIGVLTLVIFGTVFFLEKKREAMGGEETIENPAVPQPVPGEQQPVMPQQQTQVAPQTGQQPPPVQ